MAVRYTALVTSPPQLQLDHQQLAAFCERWKIAELALFGSALRDDFRQDSDVDVLVTFRPDAAWSFLEHSAMEEELASIVGREVDLVTRRTLERSANWVRRNEILQSARILYGA